MSRRVAFTSPTRVPPLDRGGGQREGGREKMEGENGRDTERKDERKRK